MEQIGPFTLSDDAHTQNVDLPVALGEVVDQHDHVVNAYGNHTHTVNIADHTHTVSIPDHTHPLTSGIIQESLGSPTLELYVNSVLAASDDINRTKLAERLCDHFKFFKNGW